MLKATSKVDCDAIKAWVNDTAKSNHYQARYISIREYEECQLDGCVAYEVYWLGSSRISMQNFYVDIKTHEIVHVTRYV